MTAVRYGNERLARLLRLLRPAPDGWVAKAKAIFVDGRAPLSAREVAKLRLALETDPQFRTRFDADPVGAAEAAGMHEIALGLEQEMRALVALAERVALDASYRHELQADPIATLGAAGMPVSSAERFLQALPLGDEALAKLPEVVAHEHQQLPIEAQLQLLLLGSTAAIEKIGSAARNV